jgi:hypothetical protein
VKGVKMIDNITTGVGVNTIEAAHIQLGEIKVHCKTGEVMGLSENITEDAKLFWDCVRRYILNEAG